MMSRPMQDLLDELWLDMEQLGRLAGVDTTWLRERVAEGLVPLAQATALPSRVSDWQAWRFDAHGLRRVRRLACLERDFDAVPELAALVAELEDEVRALRQRLARLEPRR